MNRQIYFDTQHLYYLPQFLPVARALRARNVLCSFVFYAEKGLDKIKRKVIEECHLDAIWVDGPQQAKKLYMDDPARWIVFGNTPCFRADERTDIPSSLAMMMHGIGPKSCYYSVSEFPFDVRFVEGQTRLERLQQYYPNDKFIDVGYAKLDPLFNGDSSLDDVSQWGLDPAKKTLLYAPTFYPSSIECLPKDWPSQLSSYNLIIKPHFFSLTKVKYYRQRQRLLHWSSFENVYLAQEDDFSLLPFMAVADAMIAEASSSLFEFITLDKPAIWCDFYKVRWSYRGPFRFRLRNRLDSDLSLFKKIALQVKDPAQLTHAVAEALADPQQLSEAREQIAYDMAGLRDGQCSERIADFFVEHLSKGVS